MIARGCESAMVWWVMAVTCAACGARAQGAERALVVGADVSMLGEIEKAGGVFRVAGRKTDSIRVLRENGCNLFRLRLFVEPSRDFASSWGATQDLAAVRALAERGKAEGAMLLLNLHYSDTWADPAKQTKPKAWEGLDARILELRVHEYTLGVLNELKNAGAVPEMVQVGNEIAGGMLWPEGKVLDAPAGQEAAKWSQFVRLFNAGARAVRQFDGGSGRTRVVAHIHGGGKPGLPRWFFERFTKHGADYDVIALSFYPAFGDDLEAMKQNMREVIEAWGKDVLIAETSYPWKEIPDLRERGAMKWPATPEGQRQFVRDLAEAVRAAPGGKGMGFVWWYPEAVRAGNLGIWRDGAEALFDGDGEALPALRGLREAGGARKDAGQ